jgi:hypothetical protein
MSPLRVDALKAIAEVDENVHIPIDTTFVLSKFRKG